jgi:hypothetical protein
MNLSTAGNAAVSLGLRTGLANSNFFTALSNNSGNPFALLGVDTGVTDGIYYNAPKHQFRNQDSTVTYLALASSGNVGVGTTSPATNLSVAGNGYFTGGLGIGKVNAVSNTIDLPAGGFYKYNGTNVIQASTTLNNYFFGGSTGNLTMTGGNNTANGYQALLSNTLGSNNTSFGSQALSNNTGGNQNTAVGAASLYSANSGLQNAGFGSYAGYDLTGSGADNNTLLGYNSGRGIVSGARNTILGANVTGLAAGLSDTVIIATGAGTQRLSVSSAGVFRIHPLGAGTLITDVSGNVTASSDERLKNILALYNSISTSTSSTTGQLVAQTATEKILGINPIVYKWNATSGLETENNYVGFSAQNIQIVIPEAVATDTRGYLTLSDRPILATVINAIKEIVKKIGDMAEEIITNKLRTKVLCLSDDTGEFCVNRSQFESAFSGANAGSTIIPPASGAPVVTLIGSTTVTIALNSTYAELGATITDNIDTNLTLNISGSVNINATGTYYVVYTSSTDSQGNNSNSVTRTVHVVESQSTAPTPSITITLIGSSPESFASTTTQYIDQGATAVDEQGVTVAVTSDAHTVFPPANPTLTPGSYTVTYTAANGLATSTKTRSVLIEN